MILYKDNFVSSILVTCKQCMEKLVSLVLKQPAGSSLIWRQYSIVIPESIHSSSRVFFGLNPPPPRPSPPGNPNILHFPLIILAFKIYPTPLEIFNKPPWVGMDIFWNHTTSKNVLAMARSWVRYIAHCKNVRGLGKSLIGCFPLVWRTKIFK